MILETDFREHHRLATGDKWSTTGKIFSKNLGQSCVDQFRLTHRSTNRSIDPQGGKKHDQGFSEPNVVSKWRKYSKWILPWTNKCRTHRAPCWFDCWWRLRNRRGSFAWDGTSRSSFPVTFWRNLGNLTFCRLRWVCVERPSCEDENHVMFHVRNRILCHSTLSIESSSPEYEQQGSEVNSSTRYDPDGVSMFWMHSNSRTTLTIIPKRRHRGLQRTSIQQISYQCCRNEGCTNSICFVLSKLVSAELRPDRHIRATLKNSCIMKNHLSSRFYRNEWVLYESRTHKPSGNHWNRFSGRIEIIRRSGILLRFGGVSGHSPSQESGILNCLRNSRSE